VAIWGFSYVSSFTGYRKMSAVCVRAGTLHLHMPAASHNLLIEMEKYCLLTVQQLQQYSV